MSDVVHTPTPASSKVGRRLSRSALVLFGVALCKFCGLPAVLQYTFGTFAPEITRSTGWSPVVVASAIGIGILPAALLAPFVGYAVDRFGARRVALVGGPAFGVGLILLGLLPQTGTQFVLGLGLASALAFAATPVIYAHLVTVWFSRRRGIAMGMSMGSSSLGIAFWSPLAAWLMPHGWRTAYVAMGIVVGVVIFLAALLLIRNPPQRALAPEQGHGRAEGSTWKEALRTFTFWRLTVTFAFLTCSLGGLSVNLPVILRGNGLAVQQAAPIMSVVGIAMFCGMVGVGLMLDRWFSPYVTAVFVALPALAMGLLLVDQSVPSFFVAAAVIGLGLGTELSTAPYVISRAFGPRAFGTIYGLITVAFAVASSAGPALVGVALAKSVGLHVLVGCVLALLLLAFTSLVTMRRAHLRY